MSQLLISAMTTFSPCNSFVPTNGFLSQSHLWSRRLTPVPRASNRTLSKVPLPSITTCGARYVGSTKYPAAQTKRVAAVSDCGHAFGRSEEHTSELQSRGHLVCRL